MLTSIENRLEELFEQLDMLPAEKVEAAEKVNFGVPPFRLCLAIFFAGERKGEATSCVGEEERRGKVIERGEGEKSA